MQKNIEKNQKNVLTWALKDVILIYSSKLMKINNINFERLVIFLSKKL